MWMNLMIGLVAMMCCLVFQCLLLVVALQFYARHHDWASTSHFGVRMVLLGTVMALLAFGNVIQSAVWAGLFCLLGEFDDFHTALYHSIVNFATLGYGDIVMSEKHRLLGSIEALNGIVMVGVSTSALMWALQDTIKLIMADQSKKKPYLKRS